MKEYYPSMQTWHCDPNTYQLTPLTGQNWQPKNFSSDDDDDLLLHHPAADTDVTTTAPAVGSTTARTIDEAAISTAKDTITQEKEANPKKLRRSSAI